MKRSSRGRPISAVSSDWKSKVWNYLHLHLHHNGFPLHRYEQLEITAVKKGHWTRETWNDRGLRKLVLKVEGSEPSFLIPFQKIDGCKARNLSVYGILARILRALNVTPLSHTLFSLLHESLSGDLARVRGALVTSNTCAWFELFGRTFVLLNEVISRLS